MILLALEFSSPVRSVALVETATDSGSAAVLGKASDEGCRNIQPLQLIERALAEAQAQREAIEGLVVGLGPGSYTGIRSAIAVAQGWQLARGVRLTGVGTAECLAAQAQAQGWFGQVWVVVDAQRGELYIAGFQIDAAGWRKTEPLRLATMEEAKALARMNQEADVLPADRKALPVANETIVVGPEAKRWFPEGRVLLPEAAVLGELAQQRSDSVAGEKLEPIYLRQTTFVKAPPPRTIAPP